MKKILLIEDHEQMRENTAEILSLSGYMVETAANGKIGVEMAKKINPDLIICDIMMPELDGYGVLHILSKLEKTAHIPFIFLTAKTEKEDFRKGMNLGADDYLTKPFTDIELLDAIEIRLRKKELAKKEFSKDFEGLQQFLNEARKIQSLDSLTDNCQTKLFKKKQVIFHEDSFPHGIFFILSGKVKTYKTNKEGKEFITSLCKPGEFIGYQAQINEEAHNETAEALEDSELAIIPKNDFFKLLFNNNEVSRQFIKMLTEDVKEKEEKLIDLAYNSVRKRVAQALVLLEEKYSKNANTLFTISASREDLANLVGTSKESVTRTLSDFKDEKLIGIKGSKITIFDLEKLKKMKN